jgi:CHAD domain-containing protein
MRTGKSGFSVPPSSETVREGTFVELTYKVTDRKSGHVLTAVEFPLGAYVDRLIETLRQLVPAALEEWEEEAIHQARVTTRRLKAALDLMEPVLSKQHRRPLARVLRSLRRRLGPLRDLDVMIGHLEEFKNDPRHGAAARWLVERLEPQRRQVRDDSRQHPGRRRLLAARVLAKLGAWWGVRHEMYEAKEAADTLLAESLHQQIDRFAEEAAALGRKSERTGRFQDPHELRITGKALRYTLEMAAEQGHPLPVVLDELELLLERRHQLRPALGLLGDALKGVERPQMPRAELEHAAVGVLGLLGIVERARP